MEKINLLCSLLAVAKPLWLFLIIHRYKVRISDRENGFIKGVLIM